jgi:hypothetical protein
VGGEPAQGSAPTVLTEVVDQPLTRRSIREHGGEPSSRQVGECSTNATS